MISEISKAFSDQRTEASKAKAGHAPTILVKLVYLNNGFNRIDS